MVCSFIALRFCQWVKCTREALSTLGCTALIALTLSAPSHAIPATELQALQDLYNNTNGTGWLNNSGWMSNPAQVDPCDWFGVDCVLGRVASIRLGNNKLTGTLPESLSNLETLQVFMVGNNALSGALPSFRGLPSLFVFEVNDNQLVGEIPAFVGNTSIRFLDVSNNRLSGTIPSLGQWLTLRSVRFNSNLFTGVLPSVAGLASLDDFQARNNQLTGAIPSLVGSPILSTFDVSQNMLTGAIPPLSTLSKLADFVVSRNQLTGSIPPLPNALLSRFLAYDNGLTGLLPAISGFQKLYSFDVSNNAISGPIPPFSNVPALQFFIASDNRLRGTIPPLVGARALRTVYLQNNFLTGNIPSIAGIDFLEYFRVEGNQLRGVPPAPPPPAFLYRLVPGGSALCPNQLTDTPSPAWNLATQDDLSLSWHTTCGAPPFPFQQWLPQTLSIGATGATYAGFLGPVIAYAFPLGANSSAPIVYNSITPYVCSVGLTTGIVFVRNNADVGEVCTITADKAGDLLFYSADQVQTTLIVEQTVSPFERGALIDLYNSTDGANWATKTNWLGPVGTECTWFGVTCDATKIYIINIALPTNNLNGTLPPSINYFLALRGFNVSGNRLTGAIPLLTDLSLLVGINVSDNQLSGSIPPLMPLTQLQNFSARNNALSGNFPALSGLTALKNFDVSSNQLSGAVPSLSGVTSLPNLQTFDISRNQFTGALPAITNRATLIAFDASDNQFSGAMPALTGLNNLQEFSVSTNQLTGSIPPLSRLPRLRVFNLSFNQLTGSIPALTSLIELRQFNVAINQLTGAIPALPSPMQPTLLAAVCPNQLAPSVSSAWDTLTGNTPWSLGCTAPLIPQTLTFGPTPLLIVGQTANVFATVAPLPGSTAPIVYRSVTPTLCSIDTASGLITALPVAVAGDVCTASADKAGGGTHQSAVQVFKQIPIRAVGTCSLDVNGDYQQTPEIDGVLILRYLAGIRGKALIAGLPPLTGARTTPQAIEDFLAFHNYSVGGWPLSPFPIAQPASAVRDGLVIYRYLKGLAPPELVAGTNISVIQQLRVFDRLESLRCPLP
jgi:Leucine-rich repeat (LRR) protein